MKPVILIFFICSFLSPQLQAKKLYKYKDQQGHWHYSDKPPKTEQPIEVTQLKADQKRYVWLEKSSDKQQPKYFAINNYQGPIEIEVKLNKNTNASSTPELPNRFTVPPGHSETLFEMMGVDKFKSWGYSLEYRYSLGDPNAKHDNNAIYLPPFAKGMRFPVSQAFGGKYSHTDKQNKFAVDIVMPVDTAIHAARSGKVMEVNDDFYKSGTKKAYKSRANSVRILHDDGSMAVYAHLALERAQVHPGMLITAGQLIGYSGNTGFSSGPHLHFAVHLNKGMELVSVPFKFTGLDNIVFEPIAGNWLIN